MEFENPLLEELAIQQFGPVPAERVITGRRGLQTVYGDNPAFTQYQQKVNQLSDTLTSQFGEIPSARIPTYQGRSINYVSNPALEEYRSRLSGLDLNALMNPPVPPPPEPPAPPLPEPPTPPGAGGNIGAPTTSENTGILNTAGLPEAPVDAGVQSFDDFFSGYKAEMGGTESLADFDTRLKNQEFQDNFLKNERLKTGAAFLGALSGGVQAYTGLQQLDLARESFRFNRGLARVNLANQTKLANLEIGERNLARSGKGQSSLSNAEAVDRVGLVGKV